MPAQFVIEGGKPLSGTVRLAGAKNSINKVLIASLLTSEPVVFENVPAIGEAEIVVELCRAVGSRVTRSGGQLTIETPEVTNPRVKELSRRNRIPILAIGPLLIRAGVAEVPTLGGDNLGPRPVDFHLAILEQFGARIETVGGTFRASAEGLNGSAVALPYPSVGATETAILSAVCARGLTRIANAATEPEILDLIKLLQKMGAIIEIGTNRTIAIEGVAALHGAHHVIMPDRNEAASFAAMALATAGDIVVIDAIQEHLITFLNAVRRIGGDYEIRPDGIRFFRRSPLRPIHIETDTHPGFMTDWQQPFAALLTQADGESIIHETVYEDRFGYAEDLRRMGANITVSTQCLGSLPCRFRDKRYNHTALIRGATPLAATALIMRDIRAGMAHLIAATIANGTSTVTGLEHIDRGYERLDERLRAIGADITRRN